MCVEGETAPETVPRHWLYAPLILLSVLFVIDSTDFDRTVSRWFYDSTAHVFPLRDAFLVETVLHQWTKYAVILIICMVIASLLMTWIIPALSRWRRVLAFLALAMVLAPLAVSLLKLATDRPCPWDFIEFGGFEPYTHLFDFRAADHAPGRCFPAGEPAAGFALMAFFFVLHLQRRDPLARKVLLAGMLAGVLLGVARIAQGAHFLSHVLCSGLVCWLVMVCLYSALFRPGPDVHPPPGESYK